MGERRFKDNGILTEAFISGRALANLVLRHSMFKALPLMKRTKDIFKALDLSYAKGVSRSGGVGNCGDDAQPAFGSTHNIYFGIIP